MSFAATMPTTRLSTKMAWGLFAAALAIGGTSASLSARLVASNSHPLVTTTASASTAATVSATTTPVTPSGTGTTQGSGPTTAFGQQVKAQVATCKAAAAAAGKHGIGQCVSAWVTAHNPGHSGSAGSGG